MSNSTQKSSCIVIAIAGASASGKSLIASTIYNELKAELGIDDIGIISEDVKTNYDHPNSMDHELLVEHLQALKSGNAIEIPEYSYVEHTRLPTFRAFEPKRVIILEGILLLTDETIRNEVDMSIFVDAPLDICFIRRLKRDMEERGRTMDSVISQYNKTVRPMFLQFIQPSKQYADIIVPRGGKNRVAINILKAQIRQLL